MPKSAVLGKADTSDLKQFEAEAESIIQIYDTLVMS